MQLEATFRSSLLELVSYLTEPQTSTFTPAMSQDYTICFIVLTHGIELAMPKGT